MSQISLQILLYRPKRKTEKRKTEKEKRIK
jgi:hypothetical protein